jgi:ADP-ribose pyrophosphatase YjhB (NUDIX family)
MFNIRVYGILINDNKDILVSDELIRGNRYTKFCGGGLEHGEGTINCLKREFMEEMNLEIEVISHLYTTDFYQKSLFNPNHQLISIYYLVKAASTITIPIKNEPFDFDEMQLIKHELSGQVESFRFIKWENFSPECVTLPIDKIAAKEIKKIQLTYL